MIKFFLLSKTLVEPRQYIWQMKPKINLFKSKLDTPQFYYITSHRRIKRRNTDDNKINVICAFASQRQ